MPIPLTQTSRKRTDPRGEATRTALIEAAESLFAEGGVEGVSTRQIGAAIGSSNTNVVAYHFGSKDALIREVYRHRLTEIDRRRGELLAEAERRGCGDDLRALLEVFYLPLFEQTDSEGRHSYARFLTGLERSGMIATRMAVSAEFPHSESLVRQIKEALSAEAGSRFAIRMRLTTALISGALQQIDQEASGDKERAADLFDDAITIAAAALAAPPQPQPDIRDEGER